MRSVTVAGVLFALAVAACGGGDDEGRPDEGSVPDDDIVETSTAEVSGAPTSAAPPPSVVAATTSTSAPTSIAPTTIALQVPELDVDDDPFLFFGPVSERPPNKRDFPTPDGSADYFALFEDDADWQRALAELDAFKIHFWQIRYYLGDPALRNISDFLNRHDIPLVIEAEPLNPPDPSECNHTESFEGPYDLEQARRLADLGVEVAAIAIEQPYHFAHKLDGPGACQYEVDRILDEVVAWVADMREIFPDVPIGSIEGFWPSPPTTAEDYAVWLDSYEAAAGEPFAFQHIDINWARPDWIEGVLEIEATVEERGVPFGIIFNGGAQAATSEEWIRLAAEHHADYMRAGGSPAHIGFQSWQDFPDRVLPETDPAAFTNLLVRVFGDEARFEAGPVADGSGGIAGRLVDVDGAPLADRVVTADLVPTGSVRESIVIEQVVPNEAVESLIAIRVNSEDARRGATDTLVHSITVATSTGEQLVPNGDFVRGLEGWGVYGDNTGTVSTVGTDEGTAMRLVAADGQVVNIDGTRFPIPAGETVTMTVDAEIPAGGGAPDVVLIHVVESGEGFRSTMPLRTRNRALGSATTDEDGRFVVSAGDVPDGSYRVELTTANDPVTWPTTVSGDIVLG